MRYGGNKSEELTIQLKFGDMRYVGKKGSGSTCLGGVAMMEISVFRSLYYTATQWVISAEEFLPDNSHVMS